VSGVDALGMTLLTGWPTCWSELLGGAGMVHRFLNSVVVTAGFKRLRSVHPQVLLELWGTLQLALWEASGLRELIATELPPSDAPSLDFRHRIGVDTDPSDYRGSSISIAFTNPVEQRAVPTIGGDRFALD
jgi:hypothetical protein